MKKSKIANSLMVVGIACAVVAPLGHAANYKFSFDRTTGAFFNNHATTDEGWKVTDTQNPVVEVNHLDTGFRPNTYMINADGALRSSSVQIANTGSYVLQNQGGKAGYPYRMRFAESPSSVSTFNIQGAWNPDTY